MRTRTELPHEMLRRFRKEAAFGLRELARRIGISPSFLSDIELGRRAPSGKTLMKLSVALLANGDTLAKAFKRRKLAILQAQVAELRRDTR